MKSKQGFTMAETLITMAIIGVVAMLALPIIDKARPNEEMIMFKKAFATTTRIVSELINDETLYPEDDENPNHDGFANEDRVTYKGRVRAGNTKFCDLFLDKLNVSERNALGCVNGEWNGVSNDGMAWAIDSDELANNRMREVCVDVNGLNKGNNCGSCMADDCNDGVAPDTFTILVGQYGAVTAPVEPDQTYIRVTNTSQSYQKILQCIATNSCR